MKTPKFVHVTGLILFVIYMLIAGFTIKANAQYKPNEYRIYAERTVAITLTVNLLYMAYNVEKKNIEVEVQKWLNPTLCTAVIGFTFYKAIDMRSKRKKLLANTYR